MLPNCFPQRLYQFTLISNAERPSWLSPSPKLCYFVKYNANLDKLIIIIALVEDFLKLHPWSILFPFWVWFTAWSLTPMSFGLYRGKESRLSSNGPRFAPISLRAVFCFMWPYGVTFPPSRHLSPAQPLTCLQVRAMTIFQHGPLRPRVVFGIRVDSGWGVSLWGSW